MNAVAKVEPVDQDSGNPILSMIERARALLSYNELTGDLFWKVSRGRLAKAGWAAGTIVQGRRYVKIDGKFHLAHRIIYAMKTGAFPAGQIDHIDGNPSNNAWANLRACSFPQNMQNRKVSKRNKSGLIGVSKHGNAWQATIAVDKVYHYLGRFKTPEEAHEAYKAAKRRLHSFSPEVRA